MEYRLKVNDIELNALVEREEKYFNITIGDRKYKVDSRSAEGGGLQLVVDDLNVRTYLAGGPEDRAVMIDGVSYVVKDQDLIDQGGAKKGATIAGPNVVTPPMPAVVIEVSVEVGAKVKHKDPVVVISAMKMETTLYAPYDGVVTGVNTVEGDKVMPGDILVDIEKED